MKHTLQILISILFIIGISGLIILSTRSALEPKAPIIDEQAQLFMRTFDTCTEAGIGREDFKLEYINSIIFHCHEVATLLAYGSYPIIK